MSKERLHFEGGVQRRATTLFIEPGGVLGVRIKAAGRQGLVGLVRPDSAESAPNIGKKKALTGGARLLVAVRGEGRRTGPSVGMGRACGMGRERGREKKRKRKREWAGLKDIGKEREVSIFLTKRFKQFNSNLNSREFKLELNNKQ